MKDTATPTSPDFLKAGSILLVCAVLAISGCGRAASRTGSPKKVDVVCAKYWHTRGYSFDPAHMTCDQMCEKAAAMQRADYWAEQGYTFDPDSMTASQMDTHVEKQIFRRLACCMIWYVSYAQTLQTEESEL